MNNAIQHDPLCFDALQAMASLRLSQSRPQEAVEILKTLYGKIKEIKDRIHARTILEDLQAHQGAAMEMEDGNPACGKFEFSRKL